jgi:signal transduction histidine kinase
MARLADFVRASPVVERSARPAAVVLLVVSAAAMVAASLLERGNTPYTQNLVTPTDRLVGVVMFSVPVLGFAVLAVRPRHRSGWLMLASGTAFAVYLLSHALAVRLLLVTAGPHAVGVFAGWLSTWLLVLGFGLLPFVLATWPNGAIDTRWLRLLGRVAAAGLAVAIVAQAVAPDNLEGAVSSSPIANPLGIDALAAPVSAATIPSVILMLVFTVAAMLNVVARTLRAHGELRRRLLPVTFAVLLVPLLALTALPLGHFGVVVTALVVAITGTGVGLVLATYGMRRTERAERARTALVAEREDERLRLRRELHDGVGPLLAAVRLELDRAPGPGGTACALLDDAIAEVRRISRDLRPAALDELGLIGALRQQASMLAGRTGPDVDLATPDPAPELAAVVEVNLLRISGEALTNAVRHARASHCRVELRVDDAVHLCISDDGVGCTASVEGVGMRSMRARAEELGGRFEVRPRAGGGTVVEAVLPLPGWQSWRTIRSTATGSPPRSVRPPISRWRERSEPWPTRSVCSAASLSTCCCSISGCPTAAGWTCWPPCARATRASRLSCSP